MSNAAMKSTNYTVFRDDKGTWFVKRNAPVEEKSSRLRRNSLEDEALREVFDHSSL